MHWFCGAMFAAGSLMALYIVAGYPLLLAALARRRPRPVRGREQIRSVTVILAVRNGEQWIRGKIRSILELRYPRRQMQVVVVSDGSVDGTDAAVREFAPEGVELVCTLGGGKAAALNAGMAAARGEILFFTDVRQLLDPDCLYSLVTTLGDPTVGAACGHVHFLGGEAAGAAHARGYWRYEKWIRRNLSLLDSLLAGTGCLYAMRHELARPLPAGTLLDDSYLPLGAFFQGYRFVLDEGAVAYEYPTTLRAEFRRKRRTLAGIYQLVWFCPELLTSANRMRFHFFSYRLGRIALPFALIGAALGGAGLPGTWGVSAVVCQAALYGLALLDGWLPKGTLLKRVSSALRAFFVLMAASLCALSILFRTAASLWSETEVEREATRSAAFEERGPGRHAIP